MFVEMRTNTAGAALQLSALAGVNILDCRRDPGLFRELGARLNSPDGFKYRRESPDVWTTWAVEAWRRKELAAGRRRRRLSFSRMCGGIGTGDAPIGADCEELAALGLTYAVIAELAELAEAIVTQPHGRGVAHAYARLDGEVRDLAVVYGMKRPPPGWYLQGETTGFAVLEPTPSLFVPVEPAA